MASCACCSSCGTTAELTLAAFTCGLCGSQSQPMGTLIDMLTPTVDCLRDLMTQLGARQYEVSLVWTRWSGGERGVGDESLVRALPMLPTPLVSDLDSTLRRELVSIGMNEGGNLRVSELSPRLNEDLLLGRAIIGPLGSEIPADVSFYWEVFFPRVGSAGVRRRFFPRSPPNKNPTRFQWSIDLMKQDEDRGRDGFPA